MKVTSGTITRPDEQSRPAFYDNDVKADQLDAWTEDVLAAIEELKLLTGIKVVFVLARSETGLEVLRDQGGSGLARLGARCNIDVIENPDHVSSGAYTREIMENALSKEVYACVARESQPYARLAQPLAPNSSSAERSDHGNIRNRW